MEFNIQQAKTSDYPMLIRLWERSVLTSHHFLSKQEIALYRRLLQKSRFYTSKLFYITAVNQLAGFIGIKDSHIQQLFVEPNFVRKGIGSRLIKFAIKNHHTTTVQVNEQNHSAIAFYEKHGFSTQDRQQTDGAGLNHPILTMKRKNTIQIFKAWAASLF
jgi:putative acetyltransferase